MGPKYRSTPTQSQIMLNFFRNLDRMIPYVLRLMRVSRLLYSMHALVVIRPSNVLVLQSTGAPESTRVRF